MKFSWIEIFPMVKTSSDVGFCLTLLQTALSLVPALLRVPPVEGRSVHEDSCNSISEMVLAEDVILFAFESNCLSVSKHTKYFREIQPLGLVGTAGRTHGDHSRDGWDRCSLNAASRGGEGRSGGKEGSSAALCTSECCPEVSQQACQS